MFVCVVNLVGLMPLHNGGAAVVAREVVQQLVCRAAKNPDLLVWVVVNGGLGRGFGDWLAATEPVRYALAVLDYDQSPDPLVQPLQP
ncbi:MAG: hypothetical protein AAF125_27105, partial [Chloroflexota bacterium]